ncbi:MULTISPECIES: sulfite exporter TauE/SafE family protein [Chryseobacterium]|uniref:Probable membrane transporter protein n=1 Tax=Chryseobacterium camelliae TaxID=1265445 RepID=A0ABU0TGH0_9FLAO|nr:MULTISPECIES: sulfite exporter TauE/SafE family protein [Chryseobacterium]MDT3406291.1 putative membrane protein YfcA [Pseudacidovorax intermedius]MDQ1095911.1 putative membrane protein YfcA [Chryseobacterium camelliae]MDQ1099847.1 putative membrane protein YfcA [Chryseobacterium sp. SORGH_AS_1048]MDR6087193.1 putative membrane protein YfcA [Chryseobacterium sp. SORGH_AS_0909]MDR6131566.1 putative membrane protein YfcA [Chryseobacterium sp. SORGH_AS_1175]
MPVELFYGILFLVAFFYAAVGHGGASGYLALMALYGVAPEEMKSTALMLNLFVSLTSFIQYYRGGYFLKKLFIPIAAASVPLAFIGGMITVEENIYKRILGVLLLFPVFRFFFFRNVEDSDLKDQNLAVAVIIGGIIGFLSGMIGIGGGIILSPVLLLLQWTNQKQTAAISAAFIFVNSLAGLGGMLTQGISFTGNMLMYIAVAFTGGLLGAYFGAKRFNQNVLKYILAIVLLMASYKLLFTKA